MNSNTRIVGQQALAILNVALLLLIGPGGIRVAQAQQDQAPPPPMSPEQLDQLVAPIALYPDPLLAQVLAAATLPTDVVQADRWAKQHKNLKDKQLSDAVVQANLPYDPSIISLIQFPTVLDTMSQQLDWTTNLGNAFLTQRGDLMDSVQRMRKKAQQIGNLKSSDQVKVVNNSTVIEIQPANPQVIYVPAYNPQVVYVQPPPPPPPPGPSTGAIVATGLIAFGLGVAVGAAASNNSCCWYGGSVGWSSHTVVVANSSFNRTWATRTTVAPRAPYYRGSANVNSNRNVNVNNTNVNNVNRSNTANNVNRSNTANNMNRSDVNRNDVNRGNTANNMNRSNATVNTADRGGARANSANRSDRASQPAAASRGYSQPSSERSSAFSGAQNGRSEKAASQRGQSTRGSRQR